MTTQPGDNVDNSFVDAKPFVLVAKIHLKEDVVPEFLDRVQQVLDEMRHEKSFRSTSLCADPKDPCRFMLFEVWADRDEFYSVQVNRDYRKPHAERFKEFLREPAVFEEWGEIRADYAIHIRR